MSENVNFRLEKETLKKFDNLASAMDMKRSEVLREAVKEFMATYIVGSKPTVGTLKRKIDDLEKRLTAVEKLLMKRGAEAVKTE